MKLTQKLLVAIAATALTVSLSSCASTPSSDTSHKMTMTMPTNAAMAKYVAANTRAGDNWFGGPIYKGKPALAATAALVKAGGGADNFKFSTALVAMLGQKTVNAEVAKLTKQYGAQRVHAFLSGMTFAINDGLKRATELGIKLPPPANLQGPALAKALVKAGTGPDGTFWAGHLFDVAISHKLHNQVMADIDAKFSIHEDALTHRMLNQAMYDVAQALGMKNVKLAAFH